MIDANDITVAILVGGKSSRMGQDKAPLEYNGKPFYCGPLGGIHSALSHATTPFVFIISCDIPFISVEVVVEILTRATPSEITITDDGTNIHPLVGIYSVTLLQELHDSLSAERKQIRAFLKQSSPPLSILKFPHCQDQLRNINTPPEYAAMRPK